MNKGAKLALVILGLAAIVVPVILLIVFTSKVQKVPNVSTGTRPIDQSAVEKTVQKYCYQRSVPETGIVLAGLLVVYNRLSQKAVFHYAIFS